MYTYQAQLMEKLPAGVPLKEIIELKTEKEWFGHSYGTCVGSIYDDGEKRSCFKADQKGTDLFDKLLEESALYSEHKIAISRKDHKERGRTDYYIMYEIVGHSKDLPTVLNLSLDTCCNVEYTYTYEILLVADDEYRRYITVNVKTDGPYTTCLADLMKDLDEIFEEWIQENEQGFNRNEYGEICVQFYNDVGQEINDMENN